MLPDLIKSIFRIGSGSDFERTALEVFRFQAKACKPYREYLDLIGCDPAAVECSGQIPFLPVELFKTHRIYCGSGEPQMVFTSSSTTGMTPARHYVADLSVYEEAFTEAFRRFYGDPGEVAIFALLPGYLERTGSSLIYMVDSLIRQTRKKRRQKVGTDPADPGGKMGKADDYSGGFYLNDLPGLIRDMEACAEPKILLGVSYALWDLAERYPRPLRNTVVMETGGMKGHREELPREQFHRLLCDAFSVDKIHSEYGMAELLSQAYSKGDGLFEAPPWMRLRVRDLNDPFLPLAAGQTGGVDVIDLANVYSCSFIQTHDLGMVYPSGKFRILGRIDRSDIRGCNLLVQN